MFRTGGMQVPICRVQGALGSGPGSPWLWLPWAHRQHSPGCSPVLASLEEMFSLVYFQPRQWRFHIQKPGEGSARPSLGWRRACVLPQWAGNETRPCFPLPDNSERIKPQIGQE